MHPIIAALPVDQARAILDWGNLEEWLSLQGVEWTRELAGELVERALEDPPSPREEPRRGDAAPLREFVERAARLPPRLRDVATLCLTRGMSLSQCAAQLAISRETVRVHLRRLRAMQRRAAARRAGDLELADCIAEADRGDALVSRGAPAGDGAGGEPTRRPPRSGARRGTRTAGSRR